MVWIKKCTLRDLSQCKHAFCCLASRDREGWLQKGQKISYIYKFNNISRRFKSRPNFGLVPFFTPVRFLLIDWKKKGSCRLVNINLFPSKRVTSVSQKVQPGFKLCSQHICIKPKQNRTTEKQITAQKTRDLGVHKQRLCLHRASVSLLSRGADRAAHQHLPSSTGFAEEKQAALSRSYGLYYSYKSHTERTLRCSLQHELTAWAWNWKTKVKYRDYYWALMSIFKKIISGSVFIRLNLICLLMTTNVMLQFSPAALARHSGKPSDQSAARLASLAAFGDFSTSATIVQITKVRVQLILERGQVRLHLELPPLSSREATVGGLGPS